MPESVFTQTMPSLLAGGVCCVAEAGFGAAFEAEELGGAGVGLVAAGAPELVLSEAAADAGELAGVALAAPVLGLEASADAERGFFVVPVSVALLSALSAASGAFLERLFFALLEASPAAAESAGSPDFLDRLFFSGLESGSVEAVAASAASALPFFDRLFFVPVSVAKVFAVAELPEACGDFLDRLFFVVDLLPSAVALSAESAVAPFLDRLFAVEESVAGAGSELSALFFFDFDFALLLESVEISLADPEESSVLAFFVGFCFVLVALPV